MLTSKRVDGQYSIVSTNQIPGWNGTDPGFAEITLDTNLVRVAGNLLVEGTAVFVDEETVTIADNIVVLNQGEPGAGVTLGQSGLEIDRGSELNAFILYDDLITAGGYGWVVNLGDGLANLQIVTKALGSGDPLFAVVDDTSPELGGDLDVANFDIINSINNDVTLTVSGSGDIILTTAALGEIVAAGPVLLQGAAPNVTPASNEVALYKGADTNGGTQIHYENDTTADELISKSKAIMYSLIF